MSYELRKEKHENEMKGGKNEFIMLITNAEDNDRAAERYAPRGQEILFCKLRHVRACDRFGEIKYIQRRLRHSSAVKGKRVTAVIDLSEWIGHENEPYLAVMMKFLHDMRERMDLIFTVGSAPREKASKLFTSARRYMRGRIEEDCTLTDMKLLAKFIMTQNAEPSAAELLAKIVSEPKLRALRNLQSIEELCADILAYAARKEIKSEDVREYVGSENSLPYITDSETAAAYANGPNAGSDAKNDEQAAERSGKELCK